MEENALIVTYKFNKEQLLRSYADQKRRHGLPYRVLLPMASVIFMAWMLCDHDAPFFSAEVAWQMGRGILCVGIFFGLLMFFVRFQYLRQFMKSPLRDTIRSWRITPERLYNEGGEGTIRGDFAWSMILKIVVGKYGFLLFTSTRMFQWLPYDGFEDAGKVEEFRRMAQTAGVKMK